MGPESAGASPIASPIKGASDDLALFWLSGFLSDMGSTKALVMAAFARERRLPMLRFDYSGHGLSSGSLLEASIGDWLEEASAVLDLVGKRRTILVGSSMGGWIALLLARQLAGPGEIAAARRPRSHRAGMGHDGAADGAPHDARDQGDSRPRRRPLRAFALRAALPHHQASDRGGAQSPDRRRDASPRSAGAHPARHVRSRRPLGPRARPGRSPVLRRCRAHPHQGRRPPPVPARGLIPPRSDRRRADR